MRGGGGGGGGRCHPADGKGGKEGRRMWEGRKKGGNGISEFRQDTRERGVDRNTGQPETHDEGGQVEEQQKRHRPLPGTGEGNTGLWGHEK